MKFLTAFILMLLLGVIPARADHIDYDRVCAGFALYKASGEVIDLSLELATTSESAAQGLMFREFLAPEGGMLFVLGRQQPVSFWMKNTLISLDMIFVSGDGTIMDIHERAVPHSLESVPSKVPVSYVIELAGNSVARLGIKVGDYVTGFDDVLMHE